MCIFYQLINTNNSKNIFMHPRSKIKGIYCFCPVCHSVILSSSLKLLPCFWTVSARAVISDMNIPCDKTFLWDHCCWPCELDLVVWPIFRNLNIAYNFLWVLELWHFTWVFLVTSPYHYFFTLWPWPCSLTNFLKTLTLLITFKQWVLELRYFTWIVQVMRPFCGYLCVYPVSLTLEFENFNLANNFWTVSARAFIFLMNIPSDKIFLLVLNI